MPAKDAKKRERKIGKGLLGEFRPFAILERRCLQRRRSCKQLPSNRIPKAATSITNAEGASR